jgi:hypothetical protein
MYGFILAFPVTIIFDNQVADIIVYVEVEWKRFDNDDDIAEIIVYTKGEHFKRYRIAQRLGATVSDIARWLAHVDDGEIELVKEKSNVPKARLNYWKDYAFEVAAKKTVEE